MNYTLEPMRDAHGQAVMTIFNHYIKEGFSSYFEEPLPDLFFLTLLEATRDYPAVTAVSDMGAVAGFAFGHALHPASSLKRTAEITYFVHPEHSHQGLGVMMLEYLIERAGALGIDNLVAGVVSLNEQGLVFYDKNGFRECGRLVNAGRKFHQDFDVVFYQRHLNDSNG